MHLHGVRMRLGQEKGVLPLRAHTQQPSLVSSESRKEKERMS